MFSASPQLIDCHLHLQADALWPHWPAVLARARMQGVHGFVCNGTRETDWPRVLELARSEPDVLPCFGLHPWFVAERSETWLQQLEQHLLAVPSAVGEIGLDRWLEPRDEAVQETVFRAQLELARHLQRPVMIHCVHAWGWLMDVLRSQPPLPPGMLLHAYGGPVELIKPLADMGAYFSFGGSTLDEHTLRQREALPRIPADRLLLETDAPFGRRDKAVANSEIRNPKSEFAKVRLLTSTATKEDERCEQGWEGNEPANLPAITRGIASLLGCAEADLVAQNWRNAQRLFGHCFTSPRTTRFPIA